MLDIISNLTKDSKGKQLDFTLLFTLFILLCIGLLSLCSASSYYALNETNSSSYYIVRQIGFAIAGVVAMLAISKLDYKIYKKLGMFAYIVGLVLMLLVFVPGVGYAVNGARRWVNLGLFSFQPSEMMKVCLIIGISTYIVGNPKKNNNGNGYIVPAFMTLLVCVIMYFQSHLSGAAIMAVTSVAIIITSGMKIKAKTIILWGIVILAAGAIFLFSEEYRLERVTAFFNPTKDITGSNWQTTQSLYAIGSGGLFGRGLGQSRQKYLWLPEAKNDFIFSVFAEEFGFVGSVIVVGLFAFFVIRGITIGLKSKDLFGTLITVGIIGMFAFQIVVNIAVVTKLFPATGMPLPFFSCGGTSLLINLASMGIVFNVSRQGK